MEGDRVDSFLVSVVVLKKLLRPTIKNLDLFISTAGGKTRTVRVILYVCHHAGVVEEGVDWVGRVVDNVPQLDGLVVRPGCHHSGVQRKLRASDPVLMARETLNKFALLHIPDFDELIVSRRNQQRPVRVEGNRLYWR